MKQHFIHNYNSIYISTHIGPCQEWDDILTIVSNSFKIPQNTTNDMMPVQLILYSIITKDIQKTLKMKDETWVYNCLLSLGLLFLMYNASLIVVSKSSLPRSRILNLLHEKLSLHLEHNCKWSKMAERELPCNYHYHKTNSWLMRNRVSLRHMVTSTNYPIITCKAIDFFIICTSTCIQIHGQNSQEAEKTTDKKLFII